MAMEIAPHWHCLEEDLLQYFFPLELVRTGYFKDFLRDKVLAKQYI